MYWYRVWLAVMACIWIAVILLTAFGPAFVDRQACLSIPGNTYTLIGGCKWPPLNFSSPSK